MNFQKIVKIEKHDFYVDVAITRAKKRTELYRSKLQKHLSRLDKSKNMELYRVQIFAEKLQSLLEKILATYPRIDEMEPFYIALIKVTLDYDRAKKSLGAIRWASKKVKDLFSNTHKLIRRSTDLSAINKHRNALFGRCASVLKQISKEMAYLEEARKVLRRFPVLRHLPTIVIAGFPNVGKSTLLAVLTGSEPKIAMYPFTTKHLMLGYKNDVQYIDTPGLLDRLLSERNDIELHALLALKHLATIIVFVLDPTEQCGYSMDAQIQLLNQIKKQFEVPIVIVANKGDLLTSEDIAKIPVDNYVILSAKEKDGVEVLEKLLLNLVRSV